MKYVEIINALKNSLLKANQNAKGIKGKLHRDRSKEFLEELRKEFSVKFPIENSFVVFTKHFSGNRPEFGLNELLYDLLVCETGKTLSAKGINELSFVRKAIWQIESEFKESNVRELIWDFNKLVIGSGENKMFICSIPKHGKQVQFLNSLKPIAACCSGNVFMAFLQHPKNWSKEMNPEIILLEFDKDWKLIS